MHLFSIKLPIKLIIIEDPQQMADDHTELIDSFFQSSYFLKKLDQYIAYSQPFSDLSFTPPTMSLPSVVEQISELLIDNLKSKVYKETQQIYATNLSLMQQIEAIKSQLKEITQKLYQQTIPQADHSIIPNKEKHQKGNVVANEENEDISEIHSFNLYSEVKANTFETHFSKEEDKLEIQINELQFKLNAKINNINRTLHNVLELLNQKEKSTVIHYQTPKNCHSQKYFKAKQEKNNPENSKLKNFLGYISPR